MFEHPGSSQAAKLIGMFSIFCVFVSTVILTLDTLPFFQVNIKTVCILYCIVQESSQVNISVCPSVFKKY